MPEKDTVFYQRQRQWDGVTCDNDLKTVAPVSIHVVNLAFEAGSGTTRVRQTSNLTQSVVQAARKSFGIDVCEGYMAVAYASTQQVIERA